MGKKRELGFWCVVAGLLPVAYASSYAAVGVMRAEGCSGASFEETGVIYLSGADEAPVGTDGFFPFRATTIDMGSDDALAAITVEVRDSDGMLVPGETKLLSKESGHDGQEYLKLGWSVSGAALEQGETLSFRAEATSSSEPVLLERELMVAGEVPELTLPSFEVTDWISVKYDAGPQVSCDTGADCGPAGVFGSELRDARQMTLEAEKVDPPVLVAWEFEWEAVPGKGRFVEDPRRFDSDGGLSASLLFVAEEDEYCARLRGHDLNTGETKEQDFCGSPTGDGDKAEVWDSITNCWEPPEGYLERWCLASRDGALGSHAEECAPYLNPETGAGGASTGDAGGAGGNEPTPNVAGKGGTGSGGKGSSSAGAGTKPTAGTGGTGGRAPSEGGDGPTTPEGEDDPGAAPSGKRILTEAGCACRMASDDDRGSAFGAVGLAVLGLGLGARRRRLGG